MLHHWEVMLWLMNSSLYMYCSYFYCIESILLFINGSAGNNQLPIPQYLCRGQCCLTWKSRGCHWALILLYVDLNGCLFMTASLNYVVVQVLVSPEVECHVSSFLSVPDDGHAGNAFSAADMSCCQQK